MSRVMLTVAEIEATYDRPLWAVYLTCRTYAGGNDHTPYYWADKDMLVLKRVTSKRKLSPTMYAIDLKIVARYKPTTFNLPFFEELRQANMLEA